MSSQILINSVLTPQRFQICYNKKTLLKRKETVLTPQRFQICYNRKTKFLSFADREKKLKSFTNQLNYLRPCMALKGLTPYEKWLSKKIKTDLTIKQLQNIKYIQQNYRKKVINEKLAS